MYVYWKILIGFGLTFWFLMCIHDSYFVDPNIKGYAEDYEWISTVSEDDIFHDQPQVEFPEATSFSWNLIFWNFVAFVTAIVSCVLFKSLAIYFIKHWQNYSIQQMRREEDETYSKKNSTSRIPIPVSRSTTTVGIEDKHYPPPQDDDDSTSSLLSCKPSYFSSVSDVSNRSCRNMEKQCAKLRDEMIVLQANSLKEHALLSRKLEIVTREKRDLCKQLNQAQKECRAAKQQLEELSAEKTLLVKRLDCATKEFKVNTKSKKNAFARLEEAQESVNSLNEQLSVISKDKEIIEEKFKLLETHYKSLQNRIEEKTIEKREISTEIHQQRQSFDEFQFADAEESKTYIHSPSQLPDKDVLTVQRRLMSLEQSLDKLKFSKRNKKELRMDPEKFQKDQATSNLLVFESSSAEDILPEESGQTQFNKDENKGKMQIMVKNNPFAALADNLTDEQRVKIMDPDDEEFTFSTTDLIGNLSPVNQYSPNAKMNMMLNYFKASRNLRCPKKWLDKTSSDDESNLTSKKNSSISPTQGSSSDIGVTEENSDDCVAPKNKSSIVTTPAFRQFLKYMDPMDACFHKYAAISQPSY